MRALRMLTVALCLLCGVTAAAQKPTAQPPSVQADIETAYTLPDGNEARWTGRFYRNYRGQIREDSGLGAIITDLKAGTVTLLVAETKQAHVLRIPTAELTPDKGNQPRPETFEETTIDGHRTSKARTTGPQGQRIEFWTVKELGLVTLTKSELGGTTSVRELKNISTFEPDPLLFMIPADYTVVEMTRPATGKPALPPRPGVPPGPRPRSGGGQ